MKAYQWYFFILKFIVLMQVVMISAGFDVKDSPLFAFIDMLFKLSLGLFLGIYFWLFTPKGIDWEDGIIVSIGGFLILMEIQFEPLVRLYEARDKTLAMVFSLKNG
jgi:hypothetical protein